MERRRGEGEAGPSRVVNGGDAARKPKKKKAKTPARAPPTGPIPAPYLAVAPSPVSSMSRSAIDSYVAPSSERLLLPSAYLRSKSSPNLVEPVAPSSARRGYAANLAAPPLIMPGGTSSTPRVQGDSSPRPRRARDRDRDREASGEGRRRSEDTLRNLPAVNPSMASLGQLGRIMESDQPQRESPPPERRRRRRVVREDGGLARRLTVTTREEGRAMGLARGASMRRVNVWDEAGDPPPPFPFPTSSSNRQPPGFASQLTSTEAEPETPAVPRSPPPSWEQAVGLVSLPAIPTISEAPPTPAEPPDSSDPPGPQVVIDLSSPRGSVHTSRASSPTTHYASAQQSPVESEEEIEETEDERSDRRMWNADLLAGYTLEQRVEREVRRKDERERDRRARVEGIAGVPDGAIPVSPAVTGPVSQLQVENVPENESDTLHQERHDVEVPSDEMRDTEVKPVQSVLPATSPPSPAPAEGQVSQVQVENASGVRSEHQPHDVEASLDESSDHGYQLVRSVLPQTPPLPPEPAEESSTAAETAKSPAITARDGTEMPAVERDPDRGSPANALPQSAANTEGSIAPAEAATQITAGVTSPDIPKQLESAPAQPSELPESQKLQESLPQSNGPDTASNHVSRVDSRRSEKSRKAMTRRSNTALGQVSPQGGDHSANGDDLTAPVGRTASGMQSLDTDLALRKSAHHQSAQIDASPAEQEAIENRKSDEASRHPETAMNDAVDATSPDDCKFPPQPSLSDAPTETASSRLELPDAEEDARSQAGSDAPIAPLPARKLTRGKAIRRSSSMASVNSEATARRRSTPGDSPRSPRQPLFGETGFDWRPAGAFDVPDEPASPVSPSSLRMTPAHRASAPSIPLLRHHASRPSFEAKWSTSSPGRRLDDPVTVPKQETPPAEVEVPVHREAALKRRELVIPSPRPSISPISPTSPFLATIGEAPLVDLTDHASPLRSPPIPPKVPRDLIALFDEDEEPAAESSSQAIMRQEQEDIMASIKAEAEISSPVVTESPTIRRRPPPPPPLKRHLVSTTVGANLAPRRSIIRSADAPITPIPLRQLSMSSQDRAPILPTRRPPPPPPKPSAFHEDIPPPLPPRPAHLRHESGVSLSDTASSFSGPTDPVGTQIPDAKPKSIWLGLVRPRGPRPPPPPPRHFARNSLAEPDIKSPIRPLGERTLSDNIVPHETQNPALSKSSTRRSTSEQDLRAPRSPIEYTDLDVLVSRLEGSGREYEGFSQITAFLGPGKSLAATPEALATLLPGLISVDSRRTTPQGKVKLKLSLLGARVTKCPICLGQFKEAEEAVLLPECGHSAHEGCARKWFREDWRCFVCRVPLLKEQAVEVVSSPGGMEGEARRRMSEGII